MGFEMQKLFLAALVGLSSVTAIAQPSVTVSSPQVVEGDSGITNAEFVITLSAPWTNAITLQYSTFEFAPDYLNRPYPAHAGEDFVATNGTVTFAPGETNKSAFVQVIGDTVNEADEPFGLYVEGPGINTEGICTILDDDPLELTVSDCAIVEGTGGTTYANVTLVAQRATEQTVYGEITQQSGTAIAGSDFAYPAGQTFERPPGPAGSFVCGSIPVYGDATNEDDEVFYVSVTLGYGSYAVMRKDINPPNARGVVFLNDPATFTIVNDDSYLDVEPMASNRTQVTLYGALNSTHVLQSSSDLVNWTSVSTNTLDTNRQVSMTVTNGGKLFFRALRTVNVSQ